MDGVNWLIPISFLAGLILGAIAMVVAAAILVCEVPDARREP